MNNYSDYIKSDLWRKRRERFYLKFGKVCSKCKSTDRIQLHHQSYKAIVQEPDEDLIALCKMCHDVFHKIFSKTSHDNTEIFIKLDLNEYNHYKAELKKDKEERKRIKREKRAKQGVKIAYEGTGPHKMLTPKSIRRIKAKVRDELKGELTLDVFKKFGKQ